MRSICDRCDQEVERGTRHATMPSVEARRERQMCPYCRESNVPTCRLSPDTCAFECTRCRARWVTRPT